MSEYVQVPCVVCRKPHWRPQNSRDARKTCSARCLMALQTVATRLSRLKQRREKAAADG